MALAQCIDCGREVSALAVSCPNCGRPFTDLGSEPRPSTDLVWALIGAPLAGAVLFWTWVDNTPYLFAQRDAGFVAAAVVILTGVLAALEVSNTENRSEYESGPAVWFVALLMIWVIAYPLYMFRRKRFGLPSHGFAGLIVTFVFLGTLALFSWGFYLQRNEVQNAFSDASSSFAEAVKSVQPQPAPSNETLPLPDAKLQKRIQGKCKEVSGDSYALQKVCIDAEVEAWRRLNVDKEFDDADASIKKHCTSEPYETFQLVEMCLQQEVSAQQAIESGR